MLFKSTLAATAIVTLASAQNSTTNSTVCNYGDAAIVSGNTTSLCCPNPIQGGVGFCTAAINNGSSAVIVTCYLPQDSTPNVPYNFTVPAGSASLNITLDGEDGNYQNYSTTANNTNVGPGGLGAVVSGMLPLTGLNGTTLFFFVGAGGGLGGNASVGYNASIGFNNNGSSSNFPAGANGGGFASVGTCMSGNAGAADCRLAVAAGGGGAGVSALFTGYGRKADDSNNPGTGNGTFRSNGTSSGASAVANGAGGGGAGLFGGLAGSAQVVGGGSGGSGGNSYFPTNFNLSATNQQFDLNGYTPATVTIIYTASNCLSPLQVAAARIQAAIIQLISNQALNAVTLITCKKTVNKSTTIYSCQ